MEFADIFKAYLEVGILGLCAIMMIYLFFKNHKKDSDREKSQDNLIANNTNFLEEKFEKLLDMTQKQNEALLTQITHNDEVMMKNIVREVTTHVPSPKENEELTKINEELDRILQDMLMRSNASRTCIVQYHNGGKGVNRQSFLKMSMTNEQIKLGVKPFSATFKDQFRSVLAYFVKEIQDKGFCYIDNIEHVKDMDASMYEFMVDNSVKSKYGYGIHNKEGMCIGFVCIEYRLQANEDKETIDKIFKEKAPIIETLLNLNVLDN